MKSLIESIKLHWADFIGLFTKKPAYYYTLDVNNDVQKVQCCDGKKEECACNAEAAAPQYSYEEDLLEPAAEVTPAAEVKPSTKAELKALSRLELQVMAENAGITLSGKEKKQQILNKLVKQLGL